MEKDFYLKNEHIDSIGIKKAGFGDEQTVVDILCQAFKNDPLITWMLEKSKNPDKLRIMMTYLFHQSMKIGYIFLTEDNCATAIWKCEKNEKFCLEFIKRNISFLIQIGIRSVYRILKNESFTHKQYPQDKKFCHLFMIAVLPECQGKGYASRLMDPVLHEMERISRPVFIETANTRNVKIYSKKGFKIYNTWWSRGIKLYYLKRVYG